ncbi:Sorting nexin-29-like protein [Leptotrombidium deliense]|uniref:Sorting nexin-29-like protein n=1 Tax=Leptotrombidium deliense TaxID=299467 RepID=A0A443SKB4_9ACAR|nr:Sorting nexin-29-like protein [Leptotrombidium deliense]
MVYKKFPIAIERCDEFPAAMDSHSTTPAISIWIPTAFLADPQKSSSGHHVYQIYVRIKDEEWNVYRRYSEFYTVHKNLKKHFPMICALDFPPKKTIGNKDAKVVQERREKLENYLRSVVNIIQLENNIIDKSSLVKVLPILGEERFCHKNRSRSDSRSRSDTQLHVAGTSQSNASLQHYIGL